MHIHRAGIGHAVVAPDGVHQILAGEDFARIGEQGIEQLELLLRKREDGVRRGDGEGLLVEHGAAHGQLVLGIDVAAAQQGTHAQQHLGHVYRFDHVIVGTGVESGLFVLNGILRGDHQHRDIVSRAAQLAGQLVAVHIRHHDIGDQQMDGLLQKHIQRLLAVFGLQHTVACLRQMQRHQLAKVLVVVRDQNCDHGISLLVTVEYHPVVNPV